MSLKKIVIYCRYSSDMQRAESCADQERVVRVALLRLGLSMFDIVVICDEAESGTKAQRDGFQQLKEMIARGEVAILVVDDQSRLSRAANAYAFIQDLVFAGGRFISTGEGIDTDVTGWELKVEVLQLHHGQTIRDLQHRVRRGQHGRVIDHHGSAGDFPYGYKSRYLDPDWATQLARRGPKPKKEVTIYDVEAKWVRQIFAWFISGRSIGWIAKELTRQKIPKGRRASTAGWHPEQVRRMLANAKYIGHWVWGKTTTRRDSRGRKKQVEVPAGQEVTCERTELRIIDQDVWGRAAARLAELHETFGYKEGQRGRGPKANPAEVYPRSPLGDVLICSKCGVNMWQRHSNERRYYACPAAKKGLCDMTGQVPADRAEQSLTEFLVSTLRGWPVWMQTLHRLICEALRATVARVPEERERDTQRAAELERQIVNLVNALAESGMNSPAITTRIRESEAELFEIKTRLSSYAQIDPATVALPDEAWVAAHLDKWVVSKASNDGPESLLRLALTSVAAESVIAPGKKRGFMRLRFRIAAWKVLMTVLGESLPSGMRELVSAAVSDNCDDPEFTLDLGEPTLMDRWAPQIVQWRTECVTWEDIVRRTGMDLNRVFIAWKRYTQSTDDTPPSV